MRGNKVLIIGSCPPPVGGVTVHVGRLLKVLKEKGLSVRFLPIKKKAAFSFFRNVFWADVVHLHSSNPYVRLAVSGFCWFFRIPLISTIHGCLGRFSWLKNWADLMSVRLTRIPIVLNEQSLELARRINTRTRLISAFIPPVKEEPLSEEILVALTRMKREYCFIWATNAFNLSFDNQGREIYGISGVINVFRDEPTIGLTVSDPTGNYLRWLRKSAVEIPKNVLFITGVHSFFEVMKVSDGMIRNTTTDGDALSVKEALYLQKKVLATRVVSRPHGVLAYDGETELRQFLRQGEGAFSEVARPSRESLSGISQILSVYREVNS